MNRMSKLGLGVALLGLVGCSSTVDVHHVVAADEVANFRGTKLAPVAILRDGARAELPPAARVVGHSVRVPRPGVFTYELDAGDRVQTDTDGRVVAVHSGTRTTQFIPGTAARSGNVVKGELVDHEERVELLRDDEIELDGKLEVGDELPYGGKVERPIAGGALAMGVASFVLSYGISGYVAATSSLAEDKWLWVPLAGPWVDLATRPSCVPNEQIAAVSPVDPCLPETLTKVALVASGVLQDLGAILTVVGMPWGTRADWGERRSAHSHPTVRVQPTVGAANGLAVLGTF